MRASCGSCWEAADASAEIGIRVLRCTRGLLRSDAPIAAGEGKVRPRSDLGLTPRLQCCNLPDAPLNAKRRAGGRRGVRVRDGGA